MKPLRRLIGSAAFRRLVVCSTLLAFGTVVSSSIPHASPRSVTRAGKSQSPQVLPGGQVERKTATRLAAVLDADDSLDFLIDFRGTLDPRSWRLTSGACQAPRFAAAADDQC